MSSSSALTVYPQLPPTTNFLDSQQRVRLMRSTRKLGAVLGTTPYLLENDTSFALLPLGKTTSKALKRQGSIFTHYHSSSLSLSSTSTSTTSSHRPSPSASSIAFPQSTSQSTESLPLNPPGLSTTRCRTRNKAPQLYLRLDVVPVSPTDDRIAPQTPCSPCPLTPITPVIPDAIEVRRKRMAKLTRQLGENIPAELVFAPEPPPKPTTMSPNRYTRRRTQSGHVVPAKLAHSSDNRSLLAGRQDWVGEWNRSNIRDVQKELRNLRIK